MYHIILAEDHVLVREGLKKIIEAFPGLMVIGEAGNRPELFAFLMKSRVDMVIMDISIPSSIDGIEIIRAIKQGYPTVRVLILTMHKKKEYFYNAIAAGADGYLLKEDAPKELFNAIEKIRQGMIYNSPLLTWDQAESESTITMIDTFGDIPQIKPFILRSIEFPPEHYEAGLTILSYFGKIVSQKYVGMKVRVNIEQEGLTVRMIIKTDQGNIEKIEKTLEEYGLVIKGEMPITDFISDPYQVAELKHQLRIAHVQLESQKELLAITKNMHEQRIYNLEEQVRYFHSHISNALKLLENRDVILNSAINLIDNKLKREIDEDDVLEIKEALAIIKQRDQTLFSRIVDKINVSIIQGTISGVAVKLLCDFITKYLPKMG